MKQIKNTSLFLIFLISAIHGNQQNGDENAVPNTQKIRLSLVERQPSLLDNSHGSSPVSCNQNNFPTNFVQKFSEIKQEVQDCFDKGSIEALNIVFTKCTHSKEEDEKFYEEDCKKHSITKWPSQKTFREAWIGEIFYPREEIRLFYEHSSNNYLLKRFDILGSLSISARFNNPLALYYLIRGLEIHIHTISDCDAPFIPLLYTKALQSLEKVEGNEDVYLLRGQAYELGCRGGYPFKPYKALKYYKKGQEGECRLQSLLIKGRYETSENYQTPTLNNYLALAKTYPKAYIEIGKKFTNNFEEKVQYFSLAHKGGYDPALLELGLLYQRAGKKEKALEYYKSYGDKGYPKGYLCAAVLYTGLVDSDTAYQQKSDKDLQQSILLLKSSHYLSHPETSYYLGILYLEQQRRGNKTDLETKARMCFEQAAFLGEMRSYAYIDDSQDIIEHLFTRIRKILGFIGYHEQI